MDFGKQLRSLIEERGMTQKELAKELNIAPSTMGGYTQGIREPDYATLKKIASFFKVSTDYLLGHHSSVAQTDSEEDILRIFRSLTPEQQRIYLEQGKAFIKFPFRKKD